MRTVRLVLVLLLCALALGCKPRGGRGDTLVFALSPAHNPGIDHMETILAHAKASGVALDIRVLTSHDATIEACTDADVAILSLFDYLFCHQEHRVEAGLRVLRGSGERTWEFSGEILVRSDSGIRTLKDLDGKTIAFVDRYSTTGFLLPAALLREAGVRPKSSFVGSHEGVLAALRDGRVDAAATYAGARGTDPAVAAIATTAAVPNEPVFFHRRLDEKRRAAVIAALRSLPEHDETRAALGAIADVTDFEPATDSDYAAVHSVIRAADKHVQDLVPDGWAIHNENQYSLGEVFGP